MPRTIVAFNAHPDDEALLMAGTLAAAAAAGHRVVLAVATDGDLGLTSRAFTGEPGALGERRLAELARSADAIGAARVVHLGYADSGHGDVLFPDPPGRTRFRRAPVEEAAGRLADVLREEAADVLLGHDAAGGYGHRDHVHAHDVAREAALRAGTPRLLEATAPRELVAAGAALVARLHPGAAGADLSHFARAYSPRRRITHRVDVRAHLAAKRAAMAAHASQAAADDGADRTLAAFLRLPNPAYGAVFGREWFTDTARPGARPVRGDILAGLP